MALPPGSPVSIGLAAREREKAGEDRTYRKPVASWETEVPTGFAAQFDDVCFHAGGRLMLIASTIG